MKDPDEFDQFYKDVRARLLVLTYCLTGDLPASRSAVRDAFVVTWHHWRKVVAPGGPRGVDPGPRLRPRPAPPHGEAVAPREGPRPRGRGDAGRAREAAGDAAADAAADRAHHRPRSPRSPARSVSPAPTPSASSRPPPRSSRWPARCRPPTSAPCSSRCATTSSPGRAGPAHDHPPCRGSPAPHAHRGRRRSRPSPHWSSPARSSPTPTGVRAHADRGPRQRAPSPPSGRPPSRSTCPRTRCSPSPRSRGSTPGTSGSRPHRRQHRRLRPGDGLPGEPVRRRPRHRGAGPGLPAREEGAGGHHRGRPDRAGVGEREGREARLPDGAELVRHLPTTSARC